MDTCSDRHRLFYSTPSRFFLIKNSKGQLTFDICGIQLKALCHCVKCLCVQFILAKMYISADFVEIWNNLSMVPADAAKKVVPLPHFFSTCPPHLLILRVKFFMFAPDSSQCGCCVFPAYIIVIPPRYLTHLFRLFSVFPRQSWYQVIKIDIWVKLSQITNFTTNAFCGLAFQAILKKSIKSTF